MPFVYTIIATWGATELSTKGSGKRVDQRLIDGISDAELRVLLHTASSNTTYS